jgi:ribosome assembly protein 1
MASLLSNTKALQNRPSQIRNICILAHVDHGKTTLSDCLIASNGIISQRLAGQLRYLDSREDEQSRGITMQSSAISLLFVDPREKRRSIRQATKNNTTPIPPVPYLINLIDSPGHVDFSSDVSTAVRLCDGALVVVDAVEGVCIQTQAVLRQAWEERVKPCLVINKVDRLINELYLTPLEAFHHLRQIIELVNSLLGQLANASAFAKEEANKKKSNETSSSYCIEEEKAEKEDQEEKEKDEKSAASMLFDPIKGNVVFASAIHGWGFSLGPFATLLSKKLNINRLILLKHLWGDHYYNSTKNSITSQKKMISSNNKKVTLVPMIVKYILEPIWMMYKTILIDHKPKKAIRMASNSLNLNVSHITDKILKSPELLIRSLMKAWLPLSDSVLSCSVTHMPNPMDAQKRRCDRLFPKRNITKTIQNEMGDEIMNEWNTMHYNVRNCSSDGPLIAFVSKMIAVPREDIPIEILRTEKERKGTNDVDDDDDDDDDGAMTFVAFARIFSGTLSSKQKVCIMGPKYDPFSHRMRPLLLSNTTNDGNGNGGDHSYIRDIHHCSISSNVQPMLMMGSSFELLDTVGPGNIIAIHGLGQHILKTATISNTLICPTFSEMAQQATPILSVAIEPKNIIDINTLRRGLAMLNHADPCVEIHLSSSGEMVIYCLGELHLERCLEDLKKRFAIGIEFDVSPPLVRFRETIVMESSSSGNENENENDKKTRINNSGNSGNTVTMTTPNGEVQITVSCEPMNEEIIRLIEKYEKEEVSDNDNNDSNDSNGRSKISLKFINDLKKSAIDKEDFNNICAFGPNQFGPNILLNNISQEHWSLTTKRDDVKEGGKEVGNIIIRERLEQHRTSLINGFQLATEHGPMCEEPMWGVIYRIEDVTFIDTTKNNSVMNDVIKENTEEDAEETEENTDESGKSIPITNTSTQTNPYGPLSGQIISTMRRACRESFNQSNRRLVEAVFECNMQCTVDQLGKLYSVLGQRRCDILNEDMMEGTSIFTIKGRIPVAETVGLADHMRKETSGGVSAPQLHFDRWQKLDIDPYFQPKTEEEREEFGEVRFADQSRNIAKEYIDRTRERKGLSSNKKIVVDAEKQRTLTRNK